MSKEHSIIFSGATVPRILSGDATQTRRVMKPQPFKGVERLHCLHHKPTKYKYDWMTEGQEGKTQFWECPFGIPGENLWIKEKFAYLQNPEDQVDEHVEIAYWCDDGWAEAEEHLPYSKWKPSIHMPRWASRILLEVKSVRVERLNDISEADARAEGVWDKDEPYQGVGDTAIDRFQNLWDSINAKKGFGWETNSFVWVIEFAVSEVAA